jgi:hypothetical protein
VGESASALIDEGALDKPLICKKSIQIMMATSAQRSRGCSFFLVCHDPQMVK